jgi:DNA polymerase-4
MNIKHNEVPQFDGLRKIIHLYIDDLFALVEQNENHTARKIPLLVVGDNPQNKVEAVSPEARAVGLTPGMVRAQALKRYPDALCIKPDYAKYIHIGDKINELFREYTEWVEAVSPAEAYLDITYNKMDIPFGRRTAQLIRSDLRRQLGFEARLGIAPNKMLAKIASTSGVGDAISEVVRGDVAVFLQDKPISLLPHIGARTKAKLAQAQIETIGQLAQMDTVALRELCGRQSALLSRLARGHDDQPVCPTAKAIVRPVSFPAPLYALDEISETLRPLTNDMAGQLRRRHLRCRQLTLQIRRADGEVYTAETQLSHFSDQGSTLLSAMLMLITQSSMCENGIRGIDIEFSGFTDREIEQLDLFTSAPKTPLKKEAGKTGPLN